MIYQLRVIRSKTIKSMQPIKVERRITVTSLRDLIPIIHSIPVNREFIILRKANKNPGRQWLPMNNNPKTVREEMLLYILFYELTQFALLFVELNRLYGIYLDEKTIEGKQSLLTNLQCVVTN